MNRRDVAPAIVTLLLVAGLVAPAATGVSVRTQSDEEPNFEAYVPQPTLTPGQPNELTVQLVNEAEDAGDTARTARSVEASLSAEGTPLSVQSGTTLLGSMPDSEPARPTFALDVPYDAPAGTHELELTVRYTDGDDRETQRLDVTVRIEERPVFEVALESADVTVGERGTVAVTVENVGSEAARDATVALESTSSEVVFGEAATASRFAGRLEPGESETLEFEPRVLPGSPRQSYALRASVSYSDESGTPGESRPLSVGFVPGPEQEFAVENAAADLEVGEDDDLEGRLVNAGDDPVRDVVLVVSSNSPRVTVEEAEVPLGDLGPGEDASFSVPVTVSGEAEAGPKRLSLAVEYRRPGDDDRYQVDLDDVRTEVQPETDDFEVSARDAAVRAGSGTTLRLEVTNERDETVRDVTAKLFADSPLSADDDEAYVGTLEPGESAEATFSIAAAGTALQKDYPADIDFQYRTVDGETRLSDTYTVAVTVRNDDSDGLPAQPLVVAGLVVAVLVLLGASGVAYRRL